VGDGTKDAQNSLSVFDYRLEPIVKKSFVVPVLRPEATLSTLTLSLPVSNPT
jgi:hypothetical protein